MNANVNKARGIQLIRTDDSKPGVVRFYDRRQPDAAKAFIAGVDVVGMCEGMWPLGADHPVIRAARHGITQNILDASNKLEGDERVAFIARACEIVQAGGWASAPVDEGKARENAINALMKLGFTREAAEAAIAAKG